MAAQSRSPMAVRFGKILPWAITIVAIALLGLMFMLRDPARFAQPVEHMRDDGCWEQTVKMLHPDAVTVPLLTSVADLCYLERDHEFHLENRRIQRQIFVEQNYVGRVMLWMVVAITISGVLLAAMQLFASFKLAVKGQGELGQEGSVSLENGKISLKSSVTGLLILVVSFAFFLVFVNKVYTIHDANSAATAAPANNAVAVAPPSIDSNSVPVPMDQLDAVPAASAEHGAPPAGKVKKVQKKN